MVRLVLVMLWGLGSADAMAQDAPQAAQMEEDLQPDELPEVLFPSFSVATQQIAAEWEAAWRNKPRLVSLQHETEESELSEAAVEAQLKRLGEKTFSNREWRSYWEGQQTQTETLLRSLEADKAPPALLRELQAWVSLSTDKQENQDAFFGAIESERDALEQRMEAALIASAADEQASGENRLLIDNPNAYEKRSHRLRDLERRVTAQRNKRASVNSEIRYIRQLLDSQRLTQEAMQKDLALARRELEIAAGLAQRKSAWGTLWKEIRRATHNKVREIEADADFGQVRQRSSEVELGLAESQIAFRDERIAQLQTEIAEVGSWGSLFAATWETVVGWLRTELWRIALALLAVYVGLRIALRAVSRGKVLLLERSDDDPDVEDDGDQRRQTLADVFASVARIGLFIVCGLLALEQIGINTGPLLGSVAILGLAVSFGSQNLVRDVVNGFFILMENQYAVGDVVTINGKTGTVEKITIRSTWVRSYNGDVHAIPNGTIDMASNHTRGWSRTIVEVGVGYDTDLEQVAGIVNRVGQEMYDDEPWKEQLQESPVYVGVINLGDSSIGIRTHVRVDPGSQWAVQRELLKRMKIAFDAAGIEIPFPQRVIHQAEAPEKAS